MTVASVAAGPFILARPAQAQAAAGRQGTGTSLGLLRQIDTGVLNVGYLESGPAKWSRCHPSARLA
jgi:hypothetical protein